MIHNYKPLPDALTISSSDIHGLGLFAKEDIEAFSFLGVTHFMFNVMTVRTPLGGFINHSEDPTCKVFNATVFINNQEVPVYFLETIKDIKAGEELTLNYKGTSCVIDDGTETLIFE